MSLRHAATAALLALTVTVPSFAGYGPEGPGHDLAAASSQIDALEHLASQVRDPGLRGELLEHARNAEISLDSARRSMEEHHENAEHRPAPALSYQDARAIVQREPFESDKLRAIEEVAGKGRFTTEQAAALAGLLSFDSDKQRALIALYPAVVDPARYEIALGILSFPSSRRAVEQALHL